MGSKRQIITISDNNLVGNSMDSLPVAAIAHTFMESLAAGPVVLTAPTASGKSTLVPAWLAGLASPGQHHSSADKGASGACRPHPSGRRRVLVVEPRRVACRSLARWVAHITGTSLGERVGYAVRHDDRQGPETVLSYVTPGVALRMAQGGELFRAAVVILDEFHERTVELDLLLAMLLHHRNRQKELPSQHQTMPDLAVFSATVEATRIARHLGGCHVEATGRQYPVEVEYQDEGRVLQPSVEDLAGRVCRAVLAGMAKTSCNVLVFLPGKAELFQCHQELRASTRRLGLDLDLVPLHGSLSLQSQDQAFTQCKGMRRVTFATNVAETSVTLPDIDLVVDSGLVKRTRYKGRGGALALVPVAMDSAEQRRGRAGRLGPGLCIRLWSDQAILERVTPPEILREDLAQLVFDVAALGYRMEGLPFLDRPAEHAVAKGQSELMVMGCVDRQEGRITPLGVQVSRLPVDVRFATVLAQAQAADQNTLQDVVDMVAGVATNRPLIRAPRFGDSGSEDHGLGRVSQRGTPRRGKGRRNGGGGGDRGCDSFRSHGYATEADDEFPVGSFQALRRLGCDALATVRILREGNREWKDVDQEALAEARALACQIRRILGLPAPPIPSHTARLAGQQTQPNRGALAACLLRALPDSAFLPRQRRGDVVWANGQVEAGLSRSSLARATAEAMAVLDTRTVLVGKGRRPLTEIDFAIPCTRKTLVEAGLGSLSLGSVTLGGDRVIRATLIRSHAGQVIETSDDMPVEGDLAMEAMVKLVMAGKIFRQTVGQSRANMIRCNLAARLDGRAEPFPDPAEEFRKRLLAQGISSGADVQLLLPQDLLVPDLEEPRRSRLQQDFPDSLCLGDATYRIEYQCTQREVRLVKVKGNRTALPDPNLLPHWTGWRVVVVDRQVERRLR